MSPGMDMYYLAHAQTSPIPKCHCSSTVTHPVRLMYFEIFLLTHCLKGLRTHAVKAHLL